jgi:Zn-dependent protease with chaperone function
MVINGNKLVESKDVNAWCMPGGKIVIYSGILPITKMMLV